VRRRHEDDHKPAEAGDRDEEVLGEELAAPDDQEDEADPEAECAEDMRNVRAEAVLDLRSDEREDGDPGDDVEAGGQRLGDQPVSRFCAAHSQNSFWFSPIWWM
jgi:hypothetical protein